MLDYQLVELVAQVVCTGRTPVAVVDSEEGAAGPELGLFKFRLDYVQNDRYTVLVVVPDDTLMRVSCIRGYNSISLARIFGGLIALSELNNTWIQFVLHIYEVLIHSIPTSSQ